MRKRHRRADPRRAAWHDRPAGDAGIDGGDRGADDGAGGGRIIASDESRGRQPRHLRSRLDPGRRHALGPDPRRSRLEGGARRAAAQGGRRDQRSRASPRDRGDAGAARPVALRASSRRRRRRRVDRRGRCRRGRLPGCSAATSAEIFAAMERHRSGGWRPRPRAAPDRPRSGGGDAGCGWHGPAAAAGVRTGWRLLAVDGRSARPFAALHRSRRRPAFQTPGRDLWLRGLLAGPVGSDGADALRERRGREKDVPLRREPPPGDVVRFGNLPPSTLQFETTHRSRRASGTRASPWCASTSGCRQVAARSSSSAMPELRAADAIVIDLRGNPGGVSAVAQGVAGHFVAETISLGTMKGTTRPSRAGGAAAAGHARRQARSSPYRGPLAILIDEGSASTSELFAAGLRDHDRARRLRLPFGRRRAARGDGPTTERRRVHARLDGLHPAQRRAGRGTARRPRRRNAAAALRPQGGPRRGARSRARTGSTTSWPRSATPVPPPPSHLRRFHQGEK